MRSFFINHVNGNISLYEYIDKELSIFRNKGESEQTYEHDAFWDWWRDKVEYQDDEVSFLIATDQDKFDIPENIQIAKHNVLSKKIITKKTKITFNKLKVINYPLIEEKDFLNFMKEKKHINKSIKLEKTIDEIGIKKSLSNILNFMKAVKHIFLSILLFIFEKLISPIMKIPKIVWDKIEKEKEKKADKLEQLKIKSETRL